MLHLVLCVLAQKVCLEAAANIGLLGQQHMKLHWDAAAAPAAARADCELYGVHVGSLEA